MLEPSCGTGSLAVWARAADATVITNEIDVRRRALGRLLGFDPTGHDAEFIDDLLPASAAWSVVLANPPFSSSGGRVEKNQSRFGFRHVESALRRLADGGRFAVILGESGAPRTQAGRVFWDSLLPDVRVTGAIGLPGREYYRNGTTVGVTLILGRKHAAGERESAASVSDIPSITASSVADAFDRALAAGLRLGPPPKSIHK
ncbi:MAG: class I SAM-dependent methyltransferase [Blastocatellia bacterium]|nr:class I SAM-dependent methyltransferase [Blastocatellia bacterium]